MEALVGIIIGCITGILIATVTSRQQFYHRLPRQ